MKNPNRIYGNYVIAGTINSATFYYSWRYEKFMANIADGTGYNSKRNAQYVISQIKSQFPDTTFSVVVD